MTNSRDKRFDEDTLTTILCEAGLIAGPSMTIVSPLAGGVSSDIWKVEAEGKSFVVKRALPRLKVLADWEAPVSRNASEVTWFEIVHNIKPDCSPAVLYHDRASGFFVMPYYEPSAYPVWKSLLLENKVDVGFAAKVGHALAQIHKATINNADVARRLDNDSAFHAIRLEPYLEATARAHPKLEPQLLSLSKQTLKCHLALVHGDVSPKNILVGPSSPIFLDAECAWFGDPAFDLAFCLSHLLLKCTWRPASVDRYIMAFDALRRTYSSTLNVSQRDGILKRALHLLPALFLARVDGKSPVEYITTDKMRDAVRLTAIPLIQTPPDSFESIGERWSNAIAARFQ